ncbi:hypothetical protein [Sphingobacterium siyangense]|uniref:hypothetical protein n=1 Tax=Sphingobacterium siyangense TaxID=459529 RepID=UPI001964B276|nr:hypothetical protein [Sphingobacterium siyangense]QRY60416.1 hypothetical protein JVX97_13605 [Sphingobacterium siyangense]
MNFEYKIKRTVNITLIELENQIHKYLKNNCYKISENGNGYICFVEDELSNRRRSRSDFHTRIGGGKFIFQEQANGNIDIELNYLTSINYYLFLVGITLVFGIYTRNIIMPIIFSIVLATPILFRIFYLNEHVFDKILSS